jgi:NitT/TauT family transport system ATP-binding protein
MSVPRRLGDAPAPDYTPDAPGPRDGRLDAVVRFDQVGMAYGQDSGERHYAIRHVSFAQRDGEFCCLLGLSGCGKTTILNLTAGFITPSEGQVQVAGLVVERPGPDRAMVFQDYALLPWLSVEANVELGLRLQGLPLGTRRERVHQYLAMVGLADVLKKYPHQLSGGMQQRVSIARALALEPVILLMDEPFASLDAHTRLQMQAELMRIWQETAKTVLFVTHSVEEAIYLADKILIVGRRPGTIVQDITIELPRPRDRTSEEFNAVERRILQLLEVESLTRAREG